MKRNEKEKCLLTSHAIKSRLRKIDIPAKLTEIEDAELGYITKWFHNL